METNHQWAKPSHLFVRQWHEGLCFYENCIHLEDQDVESKMHEFEMNGIGFVIDTLVYQRSGFKLA